MAPEDRNIDIELIKNDLTYIRKFIDEDRIKFKEHMEESEVYRKKVDDFSGIEVTVRNHGILLKDHSDADRWMFGVVFLILTIILTIVGKIAFFGPAANAAMLKNPLAVERKIG